MVQLRISTIEYNEIYSMVENVLKSFKTSDDNLKQGQILEGVELTHLYVFLVKTHLYVSGGDFAIMGNAFE